MHHGKSIAILFALTSAALSAAPAEALSIHPTAEGAFLLDPPQPLLAAAPATDSPLLQYSSHSAVRDESRDHDADRGDTHSDRDDHSLDGVGEQWSWGGHVREGHGDNDPGSSDWDQHGHWNDGGGWDDDGHHHRRGQGDGGGIPQTVPLPNALPLLLSGLASLLTVARRRKE